MQKSLLWALGAAVFVFSVSKAPAGDLGQWDDVDPLIRQWFRELKQPDNPSFLAAARLTPIGLTAMRRRAISTSPSSPTHVTIKSSAGHSILRLVRGSQCPTEKSSGAVAIRPGTALSSSALVVTFFVTCHLGEDRFSEPPSHVRFTRNSGRTAP
jgi:hypothetical protein